MPSSRLRVGVNVRVLMEGEKIGDSGSEYGRLRAAGVDVRADSLPGLMHDKFLVVDGEVVGTGSYNWTAAAESDNAENLLIVRSESLSALYIEEFEAIWPG